MHFLKFCNLFCLLSKRMCYLPTLLICYKLSLNSYELIYCLFQLCYVPSITIQLRARILSSIPVQMRDSLFLKSQPKTPPADISKYRSKNFTFRTHDFLMFCHNFFYDTSI